jgi:hypothetical protein
MAESTFAKQAYRAVNAADWCAVHYYHTRSDGSDISLPITLWRSLYGIKPLLATEVAPINEVPSSAPGIRRAYEKFAAAGVPMCAWLLSSPTEDFALQNWVKQGISL